MKLVNRILIFPIVLLVKVYQIIISPLFPSVCRFQPTCSHYMIESVRVWGPIKGLYLGIKRILSCHPWGGHGHDPVPPRNKKTA
jgi:putative membrane protein insertion efficiency factor